jgi:hypothetical protein
MLPLQLRLRSQRLLLTSNSYSCLVDWFTVLPVEHVLIVVNRTKDLPLPSVDGSALAESPTAQGELLASPFDTYHWRVVLREIARLFGD